MRRKLLKPKRRRSKFKRKNSNNNPDKQSTTVDNNEEDKSEVVKTQQNFFGAKLEVDLDRDLRDDLSDGETILSQGKPEAGVLFGAAYENAYFDILENEGVSNDTEINERLLEIALGMSKDELRELDKIEIVVDTTNTHMQHVGEVLQSLQALKLNDSVIPWVRDLGTSFRNLRVLSISRWEMTSLAGLSSMEHLTELYASYNDIQDLYDISYCDKLEVLDLEGNNISTWDNVSYLMGLDHLIEVHLEWNPIAKEPNYHNRVKEIIRQVRYIDNIHVDAIEPEEDKQFVEHDFVEASVVEEKVFVLSKFAKFSILKFDDLIRLADEAIRAMPEEEDEDALIKKSIK